MSETALVALLTDRGATGETAARVELHGNPIEGHVVALAETVGFHPEPGEECTVLGARVRLLDGRTVDRRLPSTALTQLTPVVLAGTQWDLP